MMKSLTKVMLAACLLMAGQAAFAASPWKKGAFETKSTVTYSLKWATPKRM